jgi:hypothetical protein
LRTTDPNAAAGQINTSARVGTLLILDVGSGGTKSGRLSALAIPPVLYGTHELKARYSYANTGHSAMSLAFAPQLRASAGWSAAQKVTGPFVFPGRTRAQTVTLQLSSALGPIPITVSDSSGGAAPVRRWVFVVTGFWTWALPICLLVLLGLTPAKWWKKFRLRFSTNYHVGKYAHAPSTSRPSLDGLRPRLSLNQPWYSRWIKRFLRQK